MHSKVPAALLAMLVVVGCGGNQSASSPAPGANATQESPQPVKRSLIDRLLGRRKLTIPAGTTLTVSLDTPVGSDTSRTGEPVRGHLVRPVMIDGVEVLPVESLVSGNVTQAERAGKVEGRAQLGLRFDAVVPRGSDDSYELQTALIRRLGPSEKKKDAVKIGVPAAGGAIVGGILGGTKGAVVGGAIGAGAGTAVVLTDRGADVRVAKGTTLRVQLTEPVAVRVER